jgi:hypothetical protein
MNFLNKFFKQNNPSEENRLLESLKNYGDALRPTESHWANVLTNFQNQMANEIASDDSIQRKYKLAREIESVFGGMGSLNDIALPKNCKHLHEELFRAVQNVLRIYWGTLGHETHSEKFKLMPIGASVRLVPKKVRYFERNEKQVIVEDSSAIREQIWQVIRYEGPDITNMPSYLVQHENTFMTARHESLDLV